MSEDNEQVVRVCRRCGRVAPQGAGDYLCARCETAWELNARSMSEAGLPYFKVSGGPFASEQRMGWHITDEKGFTVAVSCDDRFSRRVNMLNELKTLLGRMGALYHLSERHDGGYLEVDDASWERFKELMESLEREGK